MFKIVWDVNKISMGQPLHYSYKPKVRRFIPFPWLSLLISIFGRRTCTARFQGSKLRWRQLGIALNGFHVPKWWSLLHGLWMLMSLKGQVSLNLEHHWTSNRVPVLRKIGLLYYGDKSWHAYDVLRGTYVPTHDRVGHEYVSKWGQ